MIRMKQMLTSPSEVLYVTRAIALVLQELTGKDALITVRMYSNVFTVISVKTATILLLLDVAVLALTFFFCWWNCFKLMCYSFKNMSVLLFNFWATLCSETWGKWFSCRLVSQSMHPNSSVTQSILICSDFPLFKSIKGLSKTVSFHLSIWKCTNKTLHSSFTQCFLLLHLFPFLDFLFKLRVLLSLDALVDFFFELFLLALDLLQLRFPFGLQIRVLRNKRFANTAEGNGTQLSSYWLHTYRLPVL